MESVINLIYIIVKIFLAISFLIPLFLLLWIFDTLNNKNGQYNQIVKDLKAIINWLTPGFMP
jgi:hypothetical protein